MTTGTLKSTSFVIYNEYKPQENNYMLFVNKKLTTMVKSRDQYQCGLFVLLDLLWDTYTMKLLNTNVSEFV